MGAMDLHCHGALGYSFDDADVEGVAAAVAHHRERGSDGVMLSLVSAPIDRLAHRLAELRGIIPDVPGALGVHLEGPFLAPGRRGAHDEGALADPTPEAVRTLIAAGDGILRQVTIAPELPGALAAIRAFADAGVIVAVGHTDADYAATLEAFDHGARLVTHAFNAMPGLHHRDPGPVGAALERDDVVLELIADGVHVHPALIRAVFAAAPGRVALVTDAMSATGLGDGAYTLGDIVVDVTDGRPVLRHTETLAGTTLTMDRAVEVCLRAGVPEATVREAVSTVPARVLGGR
jgi:N-acetylglucosamine-6-phosphate deacetylase